MKRLFLIFIIICPFIVIGQSEGKIYSEEEINTAVIQWLRDLNSKGMEMSEDSVVVSIEFKHVLNHPEYRATIYPKKYEWQQAVQFLKNKEIKKTFWFFINLYNENETNKNLILKSLISYDELLKMDEILINTFYTYSFMDPEISIIKDGKPEIVHPDVLETKLRTVKEMIAYIILYREKKELESNKN